MNSILSLLSCCLLFVCLSSAAPAVSLNKQQQALAEQVSCSQWIDTKRQQMDMPLHKLAQLIVDGNSRQLSLEFYIFCLSKAKHGANATPLQFLAQSAKAQQALQVKESSEGLPDEGVMKNMASTFARKFHPLSPN